MSDTDVDDDPTEEGPASNAREVLEYLVGAVVSDPDAIEIEVDDRGRRVSFEVRVGPGDMGRVIGRRGRVARSIRTVVRAAAVLDDVEVDVDFED